MAVDAASSVSIGAADISIIIAADGKRPCALDRAVASVERLAPEAQRILVLQRTEFDPTLGAEWTVIRDDGTGVARARNIGARQATRAWLHFLDDDAELVPWWWRIDTLDPAPPTQQCGALALQVIDRSNGRALIRFPGRPGSVRYTNAWRCAIESGLIVRATAFRNVGGFDEQFGPGCWAGSDEGLDLTFRLLRSGERIEYSTVIAAFHPTPHQVDPRKKRDYGRGSGRFVRVHRRQPAAWRYAAETLLAPILIPYRRGRGRSWWIGRWARALGTVEGVVRTGPDDGLTRRGTLRR